MKILIRMLPHIACKYSTTFSFMFSVTVWIPTAWLRFLVAGFDIVVVAAGSPGSIAKCKISNLQIAQSILLN